MIKPPGERLQQIVKAGEAEPFEPMTGRPMNGWVVVARSADWGPLVDEAREFVQSQGG